MKKKHINFGSIESYRVFIKNIISNYRFEGLDENGKPIYNTNKKLPTITCTGTEKIHGTNAGFVYTNDEIWYQARKRIITPDKDNFDCAFLMDNKKDIFIEIIKNISEENNIDFNTFGVALYMEYCGGSIQKNSCVSGLEKMFIIFPYAKVFNLHDPDESNFWIKTYNIDYDKYKKYNIFNVMNFPTIKVDIDLNYPSLATNDIVNMTEEIENNSNIAKYFNKPDNIGEGLVFYHETENNVLRFKSKGEKHSKSKVKKIKEIDIEKEQNKIDFANYATPAWRLEQMWQELFGINNEIAFPEKKYIGDFIRLVIADIKKEESDILEEKKLLPNDVNKYISNICKNWFLEQLEKDL